MNAYLKLAGNDAIEFANQALSIGREFLPPAAIVVLEGGEGSEEYWTWLIGQWNEASR